MALKLYIVLMDPILHAHIVVGRSNIQEKALVFLLSFDAKHFACGAAQRTEPEFSIAAMRTIEIDDSVAEGVALTSGNDCAQSSGVDR